MKNIKILTILVLLMGFGTVYSQQATSGQQKSDQDQKTVQADRTTLSPNPEPGELTLEKEQMVMTKIAPSETDDSQSANPSNPDLTEQITGTQPETKNTEDEGPNPNNPNGIRPDTK